MRLHGPEHWYRHDYSDEELGKWAKRIKASGAKRAWAYFNDDYAAHAPKNASELHRLLAVGPRRRAAAANRNAQAAERL